MKNLFIIVLTFISASVSGQWVNNNPKVYNARNFGAKGDGVLVYDCVTTAASPNISSATAAFTSTAVDAGKIVHIDSAGGSHARFTDTILTVTDASHAILKHNATFSTTVQMMDYGTDDVPGIQAAVNAAFISGGGVVILPNPSKQFYDLASPYVTNVDGINPNCQIYMPLDTGRMNGRTVELRGEVAPFFPEAGQVSPSARPTLKGVVLYSTITSGSGAPSIIGSSFYNNGFSNTNYATWVLNNLCIRAYTGCKTHPVAGNRNALNFTNSEKVYGDNLMIDNSCEPESSIAPGATIGIQCPAIFNFAETYFGRIFIVGYETGALLGEHTYFNYLTINQARYGITPTAGAHGTTVNFYQCENMAYGVYLPNSGTSNNVMIVSYLGEEAGPIGWYAFAYDVFVDPAIARTVTILHIDANSGFTCNDPSKVKTKYMNQTSTQTFDIDNYLHPLTDAGTVTMDMFAGHNASWTLTGNHTLAFSNISAGDRAKLAITENATGGFGVTFPIGSQIAGAINSAANATSIVDIFYDGAKYYVNVVGSTGAPTQQTLTDAATIAFPVSAGSVALLHLNALAANSNRNINITGTSTPNIVYLKVFHDSVGTTITLPGRYAFDFQWATQQGDVTLVKGINDGSEWIWESTIMPSNNDPTATAFIAAVVSAGGSVSTPQQAALNTFYTSLKANSIFTKIQAMYYPVFGTAAADKYNMVNTGTFQLTWNGSWTHASSGVTPDGSTAWAQTGFNPSTNATQNSFGMAAYVQVGGSQPYIMGNFNGTVENALKANASLVGGVVNAVNADELTPASTVTRLDYIIRASSSSFTCYRDGSVISTFPKTSTSLAPFNGNVYLGALNSSGSAAFFGNTKISMYILTDGTLNATDAANLASAVQALHTSFGIQQ